MPSAARGPPEGRPAPAGFREGNIATRFLPRRPTMTSYRVTFRLKRPVPDVPPDVVYIRTFHEERSFVDYPAWEWYRKHKSIFRDKEVLSIEAIEG
jgi:hypothetical protein